MVGEDKMVESERGEVEHREVKGEQEIGGVRSERVSLVKMRREGEICQSVRETVRFVQSEMGDCEMG